MLTTQDQKLIERSLGKQLGPIKTDIDAIQTRLASLEKTTSLMDHLQLKHLIQDTEKRVAAVENKLSKVVTKGDFRQFVTKDDLKKSTKTIVNDIEKRIDIVENSVSKTLTKDEFNVRSDAIVNEINKVLETVGKVVDKIDHIKKTSMITL